MKNTVFTGAGVAIVTPMHEDFSINYEKLRELIEWQILNGTDAIVACGTTGESATMSTEEHIEVIRFTIETVAGRVPVVAGTGSNETAYAAELSNEAEKAGADALLLVTPYYNKTSQMGLIKHYNYIADRVNTPVILYNVPSRTGVDIKPQTYAELCKHPNIVATKEANGKLDAIALTMNLCGDNLDIYSGEDGLISPTVALGGKGVISVLSNVVPKETHDIAMLGLKGDFKDSAALQIKYAPLVEALFSDVNPIPVKTALNLMGRGVGECRLPLCEMTDSGLANLKKVLGSYKLI